MNLDWHPMAEGECRGEWAVDADGLYIALHDGDHGAAITDPDTLRQLIEDLTAIVKAQS